MSSARLSAGREDCLIGGGGACDMAKKTWVNTNHFWKFILFLELHFLEIHGGFFFETHCCIILKQIGGY